MLFRQFDQPHVHSAPYHHQKHPFLFGVFPTKIVIVKIEIHHILILYREMEAVAFDME